MESSVLLLYNFIPLFTQNGNINIEFSLLVLKVIQKCIHIYLKKYKSKKNIFIYLKIKYTEAQNLESSK